jgi:hypothetical protein
VLRRTFDAAQVNHVLNHPEVRPGLGGSDPLDATDLINNPANIALFNDLGGFIFTPLDADLYEVHTQFTPEGRGADLVTTTLEALRWVFTRTPAMQIVTKCPKSNPGALGLARAIGGTHLFDRNDAWAAPDGSLTGVTYMGLTLDAWKRKDPVIADFGSAFHDQLERAKIANGSELAIHPDDEAHDRAVGASWLMVLCGNSRKAVWTYNRWALLAGYQTIELVSESPLVIDVRDALVTLENGAMEVLQCR